MVDPVDTYQGKSLRQILRNNDFGKRLLVAVIVTLCLALFIHFREVRVDYVQLNSYAKNYVVAQVDFEFPDEEGTKLLTKQALSDVGPIYRINSDQIKQRREEFERTILQQGGWRTQLQDTTFEEIYAATDELEAQFDIARFTTLRTYKKLQTYKFLTDRYFVIQDRALPVEFWNSVRKAINNPAVEKILIDYFKIQVWNLVQDTEAEENLKEALEAVLPQKYTRIQAGSRIIDKGEKINEYHLEKLRAMKKALAEGRNLWQPLTILSSLMLAILVVTLMGYYLKSFHKKIYESARSLALLGTIVIITLIFAKLVEYSLIVSNTALAEYVRFPLIVPFASILICILLGAELAFFATTLLTVSLAYSLALDHFRFLIINMLAGIVSIFTSRNLRKRKEVFGVIIQVWICSLPIILASGFIQNTLFQPEFFSDLISTLAFLMVMAILIVGLLPILESIFGMMTDMTLMEYLDPSNELLRRLSIEAPGTYQHSLVVASLSEAAAQAIGASGLFCRVATMYHDIGKLLSPHYFTENQMGGFNIHQLLTPSESAQVIIAHVKEGEMLARKHGLPESFIDIIKEHHGTTLVYYFYCKQIELLGGDSKALDESVFRYPGPLPRSKESAIIMIADTVEAASRSLDEVNEETITELVNRLVDDKIEEGQFNESNLTFEELQIVKRKIIRTLGITRHLRIKYPEKR